MEQIQDSRADVQERFELVIEKLSGAVAITAEGTARLLVRLSVIATISWILFTIAVAIYASFRFMYLPTSSHLAPLHFNYDTENGQPTAIVQIVPDDSYMLRSGQAYDVSVLLDVPETAVNKDLGIVMVKVELDSRKDGPVRTSKRPIMLKYKSWLQEYIVTAALWPRSLLGFQKESQELYVFMFEDFVDNPAHPVTRAKVTLSKPIQIYYAQLRFDAHFSGLRHLMYWYPMTSGAVIVGIIFICEALGMLFLYAVLLYSWAAARRDAEGSYDEFDDGDDYDDSDLDLGMGSASGTNVLGVEEMTADIVTMATDDTDDLMGNGLRRRL